jgi:2,3-bisphosphoglycerate-dependent phosphoglycerate mutase
VDKYGSEQVMLWRRSYDIPPPECDVDSPHNPANDPAYKSLSPADRLRLPRTESLKVFISVLLVFLSNACV